MLDKSIIIYEDDQLIVLNKPAGLIVNRATSHQQESLQAQMTEYLSLEDNSALSPPDQTASPEAVFAFRQGMVHRLDKDTSGVLLWAKTPAALAHLLAQFQNRHLRKVYTCLVHGVISEPTGRIFLPLARHRTNRQIMAVRAGGRPALTNFTVTQTWPHPRLAALHHQLTAAGLTNYQAHDLAQLYQGFSLLQVEPKTGRTHQIRAHLTHRGHPLVGDVAYLPRRKAKLDPYWCPRQFLHAGQLSFTHPATDQPVTFTAPLPADLTQVLQLLS